MSNPGSVHVESSVNLSPGHDVDADELKTYRDHELDEAPCNSHPDEMADLKKDIKLEIEEEIGATSVNNLTTSININPNTLYTVFTDPRTTSTASSTVTLGNKQDGSEFIQINTSPILEHMPQTLTNGFGTTTQFLLSTPTSAIATHPTSAISLPTNDRSHVQANIIYPTIQSFAMPQSHTLLPPKQDFKPTSQYTAQPAWSYPAYIPNSTYVPGSFLQPIAAPYQVLYTPGFQPNQLGNSIYASQVLIQPPNASVDSNGLMKPQQKEKRPHIKKPLNAFMLFMKDQRNKVIAECTLKESAAINQILGKMWHALDKAEQNKYYEMARKERATHMQMYPSWSARDNYACKSRRKRKKKDSEDGVEGRKCRARYGVDHQHMWCTSCRKKKRCLKFSEDSQSQNGLNDEDLNEDYCNCDTQANIINDTLQKLLAKKEQFYADCPTNSHDLQCYDNLVAAESHKIQVSTRIAENHNGYDSEAQTPSDEEGTIATFCSQPSVPEAESTLENSLDSN